MRRHLLGLSIAIALCSLGSCGAEEDAQSNNVPQQPEQTRLLERLRTETLKRVKAIRVVRTSDGSVVELIEIPLMRFAEPTRGNEAGSLWVWGKRGRPLIISEVYRNVGDKARWTHLMSLSSNELVTADTVAGRWAPRSVQTKMKVIPNAPPPAARTLSRLRQMKRLARQFEAHQFWEPDNTRYELRLLISPVHRYEDAKTGLHDGAVFVFAHGTNPEIVMFIEAHVDRDKTSRWHIGFASLGSAEMHVTLEDADAWKLPRAPGVVGLPSDPYWLFAVSEKAVPSPEDKDGKR